MADREAMHLEVVSAIQGRDVYWRPDANRVAYVAAYVQRNHDTYNLTVAARPAGWDWSVWRNTVHIAGWRGSARAVVTAELLATAAEALGAAEAAFLADAEQRRAAFRRASYEALDGGGRDA